MNKKSVEEVEITLPLDAPFMHQHVKVNKHGLNKKLSITEDVEKLLSFGFRKIESFSGEGDRYSYYKTFLFKRLDLGFYVSFIPDAPKGEMLTIDIIDEAFGQPYDYQGILEDNPCNMYAAKVFHLVEEQMKKLSDAGIIEGHVYGEYI